jgi:lauroyl/myristoyl acyltransferase
MTRSARLFLAHTLARLLGFIAQHSMTLAFRTTDSLAKWSIAARRGPTAQQIRELYPGLAEADVRPAIRQIWTTQVRNMLLLGLAQQRGVESVARLVSRSEAVDRLRPPLIIATFHIGPALALAAVAERAGVPVLGLRSRDLGVQRSPNVSIHSRLDTEEDRTASFLAAHRQLREGGFVFIAVDPEREGGTPVPFMGRTLRLARGAFALTRMTGVPIVPIVPRWDGTSIEFTVGPALYGPDEATVAADAARWLELYLREHPGELSNHLVRLTAPER